MIDISLYRQRIGTFSQVKKLKTSKFKRYQSYESSSHRTGQYVFSILQSLFKLLLLCSLLATISQESLNLKTADTNPSGCLPATSQHSSESLHMTGSWQSPALSCYQHQTRGKKLSVNFLTRYLYGNRRKGILNMHLNIRSLKNKVTEVKNLIKQHNPHIFGLSECELKKVNQKFDETILKVPGYQTIFPKSWASLGQARVIMYVKKTLEFEHVVELENEEVQSIWIKAGFKNGKKIYFCHGYREHTSSLGNSLRSHRSNLELFLS